MVKLLLNNHNETRDLFKKRGLSVKLLYYYCTIEKFWHIGEKWDKLSPSEKNAIEFAHTNINPEPNRMAADGIHISLEYCLAHSGERINERYRRDRPDPIDLQIADMIATHRTKIPVVLYRGICEAVFRKMCENAQHIDNADFYEKAFLQTSLVKGHEIKSQYHLRIYVPEGAQAIYLGNVNYEQKYYEVVLQCGSRLKIISMDNKYINCRLLLEYEYK